MTILERMDAALADLALRWGGRRAPKAFYLAPADWLDFMRLTDGKMITLPFGNNPVRDRTDPAYNDVPVRQTKSIGEYQSRLYDHAAYGHQLPSEPGQPRPKPEPLPPLLADQVFAKLDAISRTRALTDRESLALEAAMKGRVQISRREAIRLGITQ